MRKLFGTKPPRIIISSEGVQLYKHSSGKKIKTYNWGRKTGSNVYHLQIYLYLPTAPTHREASIDLKEISGDPLSQKTKYSGTSTIYKILFKDYIRDFSVVRHSNKLHKVFRGLSTIILDSWCSTYNIPERINLVIYNKEKLIPDLNKHYMTADFVSDLEFPHRRLMDLYMGIRRGSFPDYGTYLLAKTLRIFGIFVKNYSNLMTEIKTRGFNSITELENALKLLTFSKEQYLSILERYETSDPDIALSKHEKELGLLSENLSRAKEGGFNDIQTYLDAVKLGCQSIECVNFVTLMKTSSKQDAIDVYLEQCYSILKELQRKTYFWQFSELINLLDIPNIPIKRRGDATQLQDLPVSHELLDLTTPGVVLWFHSLGQVEKRYSSAYQKLYWIGFILGELKKRGKITGSLYIDHPSHGRIDFNHPDIYITEGELNGYSEENILLFKSDHLTDKELESTKEFLLDITDEIQIPIQRVVLKTKMELERCERAVNILIEQSEVEVNYYEKEGIIVKKGYFCQICSENHPPTTPNLQCQNCNRYVCEISFRGMKQAGKTSCPMCDGMLIGSKIEKTYPDQKITYFTPDDYSSKKS